MISSLNAPRYLMIANALKSALFAIPVLVLYYNQKGVSIGDFFLIQGISWLFVFVLELPSGYIGDVFSRKYTLISGFLFIRIFHLDFRVWILVPVNWGIDICRCHLFGIRHRGSIFV